MCVGGIFPLEGNTSTITIKKPHMSDIKKHSKVTMSKVIETGELIYRSKIHGKWGWKGLPGHRWREACTLVMDLVLDYCVC